MYNEYTVDRVMNLCFSPEGVAYGLTFGGRLVKFDRETGAYSVVGETKWNINYVSCSRWDEKTGLILYSFTNQDGRDYFYTIDPNTAERSMFEETSGCITAFFTPLDYVKPKAPAAPENVTLTFPEGSRSGKLSFKAPAKAQNGDEIEGSLNYRVVRKGKTVAEGTVRAGAAADVDINAPMDGVLTYSVVLSNNYGESLRGKTSAFAGNDTPATPVVAAEKADEGIRLSWEAVVSGVNGGYIDSENVYYTVKRFPGDETVGAKVYATTFTDKIEMPSEGQVKQYWYTVTAYSGETPSAAGKSNKIVLGYFTPTWEESFSEEESLDNFTIINNSCYAFDEETTSGWTWNNYWRCAGAFYHPYADLDDWLITPPMMMEKGKTYRISFKTGSYADAIHNFLEVRNGTDNTVAAMTNVLLEKFNVQTDQQKGDWMKTYSIDFVPEEDGLQYFGFHCLSQANQTWLYLDEIKILEGITSGAPKAVENLTINPDRNGLPKAVVSFRLPELTVDDKKITGAIKAEVVRGGKVVFTASDKAAGDEVSFTDEVGTHGNQDYQVRAYSGDVPGMPVLSTVFVGNYYPLRPADVIAKENPEKYGEVTISWTAPEEDERGRGIAAENLWYEIEYAWANGQTGTLVSDLKDTFYTYAPKQPSDKEEFVVYQVWAYTPYGKSNVSTRAKEQTPVGTSYKAPWHESFSVNPPVSPLGVSLINGTPTCGWHVYNDTDGIDSQDGDNCFAGFSGVAEGNAGAMYTGKLDLGDISDPMLSFWVYKMGPEDINTLEVSVGGFGEWEAVDMVSMDQLEEGWNKIEIPMDDYAGKTVQVKWAATVKLYSYVLLDNLNIASTGAVNEIDGGKEPVESRFFTLDGLEVKAPVAGSPCIVVTTYSDGTKSTRKIVSRR